MRFALSYLRGNLDSLSSYRRHFPDREKGVLRGEITPDYCQLGATKIATMKREFPELKLLLTLRHPLQRFESQVCKYIEQTDDASAQKERGSHSAQLCRGGKEHSNSQRAGVG